MKNFITFVTVASITLAILVLLSAPGGAQAQTSFCYTFKNNLSVGRSINSADAQALTKALSDDGLWSTNTPIVSYTDAVAGAVSQFQEKYTSQILTPNGLSHGTGFVGVSTRAKLNSLYSCSTPTQSVQPTQCPLGYICTPANQNPAPVCPVGYTCKPANPTNSANQTNATPNVNSSTYTTTSQQSNALTVPQVNNKWRTTSTTSTGQLKNTPFQFVGYIDYYAQDSASAGCGLSPSGQPLGQCPPSTEPFIIIGQTPQMIIDSDTMRWYDPSYLNNSNYLFAGLSNYTGSLLNNFDTNGVASSIANTLLNGVHEVRPQYIFTAVLTGLPFNPPYTFPVEITGIQYKGI